ncbi:MAG: metallophosphoesterase [Elusimicrobia bacterium]|nr:metallophosphoesterase [Elusimicrobiota bacterium]
MKRLACGLLFVFCFANGFQAQTAFSVEDKAKKSTESLYPPMKIPGQRYKLSEEKAATEECSKCIVIYGDTRTNHEPHKNIVKLISGRKPETVFHTGDMVSDGAKKEQWDIFEEIVSRLRKNSEFFPIHGNHEWLSPIYFRVFNIDNWITFYSLDRHNIHFTVIDSEVPFWKGSWQYKWLEHDLKQASLSDKTKFTVALLHQPFYSSSKHGSYDSPVVARELAPLFEKYGVDIVFSGHDHCYERLYKDGIFYVVAGAGGAPLYDMVKKHENSQVYHKSYHYVTLSIQKDKLSFEVFDDTDKLIDSFKVMEKEKQSKPVVK